MAGDDRLLKAPGPLDRAERALLKAPLGTTVDQAVTRVATEIVAAEQLAKAAVHRAALKQLYDLVEAVNHLVEPHLESHRRQLNRADAYAESETEQPK